MTERDAFLQAIVDDPADDGVRLVYADWLEEHGEPERAEFIRVQVELARNDDETNLARYQSRDLDRLAALRRREMDLFVAHVSSRAAHQPSWGDVPGVPAAQRHLYCLPLSNWRRGFIASVSCTLAAWYGRVCGWCDGGGQRVGADRPFEYMPNATAALRCPACRGTGRTEGHGPALVRACPLEEVRTDREPYSNVVYIGEYQWYDATEASQTHPQSDLPIELFDLLADGCKTYTRGRRIVYYRTEAAAQAALAAACLAWARGETA